MAPSINGFPRIRDSYQVHPDLDIDTTNIGYLTIVKSQLCLNGLPIGNTDDIDSTLNSLMVQITKKMLNG